ncbi:putative phage terminase, large subunit [Bordetella bronchiseptica GA96-01]|uniref:terminase large subunit n=1 Tax=Bordetella bronchiseptica TaxID=518 RepID=UPI00045989F0|nr:terminase TerL endonuclease subunit [Bordetella bronchiseptica]AZW31512.1 terminase large subunit [Bordetella bronchiseptica]KCV40680.1 putative phage terminase, large subunit [Bordetella bronchiseptica 345]KDC42221.1 putative phage terminase, large subunit [Bordetella bronchiseptica GA96-01]
MTPVQSYDWEWYGREVMAGRIPVCRLTRLAVERHYRDLETGAKRGLWFSEALAQHALESFLFLRHSKGEWAGRQFELAPWQQFWIALAFGWMRLDGTRRFREVWEEVPRKNGKSTKLAGIGLYLFTFDGEGGAEVYSAATKMEQAKITHSEAVRMVEASPHLRRSLAMRLNEIYDPRPGRADKFVPLGRDAKSLDGLNPHGGILDEVHAHPTREIYDVIKSGMGSRKQPMIWQITTAGFDLSSFGYSQHEYAEKVLEGIFEDDELLVIIYTVDHPDRWDDPVEMAKANPNLGVSVYEEQLRAMVERAKRQPSELPNVLTKRLNIWLRGGSRWVPADSWKACGDGSLSIEDFVGEPCWVGLDLAEKKDVAALCIVFKRDGRYYAFFKLYLNEEQVQAPENRHYFAWEQSGHLIMTPGNATDFDVIRRDLVDLSQQVSVQEVVYDPKFATYFAAKLRDEDGLLMVEMPQTSSRFTLPIVSVENLVLTKDLQHDANPAVAWMISNVVMRESKFSGLKHPTKEKPENKIDAAIALIQAMSRALSSDGQPDMSDYFKNPVVG